MNNRADIIVNRTLERILLRHFERRPYARFVLSDAAAGDDPGGCIAVHHHQARDDIVEYKAEISLAASCEQEGRLMDRMLEIIDVLHERQIPEGCDSREQDGDPLILGVTFEAAAFERQPAAERAAVRLTFNVRTLTD